ncbi:hypothetical protein TNCV_2247841 [Trichonephila clavipes]|nr:hypothetical protein TNCV_2247841 [Trichonephila clavipes]
MEVTLIVVYDWEGVIFTHAVPTEQTVNTDYYCRFLQHHLRTSMRHKCSRFLQKQSSECCMTTLVVMSQKMSLSFGNAGSSKS